jgi:hypothetical protein
MGRRPAVFASPLATAILVFGQALIGLTACGGLSGGFRSLPKYTVSVSPQPASIPVNGTVTFTATTTPPGGEREVSWWLVGLGENMGSPTHQTGATFTYTAPPTPPIPLAGTPGVVTVRAQVPTGGAGIIPNPGPATEINIVITAPSITTGFTSTINTVALGQTLYIYAYAVGSTNNAITMQVNGTTGGAAGYGTITPVGIYGEYAYTAPATMPMTGNTVTITVVSLADPTKSSSMTITLT